MMEDHVEKLDSYLKLLFAGDPTDAELENEKQELETFKGEATTFAEQVQNSPWIPEMQKLRKSVEEDEAKLEEEQKEVGRLEEAVNRTKAGIALCRENSFVDLVVKLVKYKIQRDEMLRIYAKGLAEHKWIVEEIKKRDALESLNDESMVVDNVTEEEIKPMEMGAETMDHDHDHEPEPEPEPETEPECGEIVVAAENQSNDVSMDLEVSTVVEEQPSLNESYVEEVTAMDRESGSKGVFDKLFASIDAGNVNVNVESFNPLDMSPCPSHISFEQAATSTPQGLFGLPTNSVNLYSADGNTSFDNFASMFDWGNEGNNTSGAFFDFGFGSDDGGVKKRKDVE